MATKKSKPKSKSNVSRRAKKQSLVFKWWMAAVVVITIAVIGIIVLRFSRASIDSSVSNQKAYQAIVNDRKYWASKGDKGAAVQTPSAAPTAPPPRPADWGTQPAQTPPSTKPITPTPAVQQQNNTLPDDYPNIQSYLPNIGKAEAYGGAPCSTTDRCNIMNWANSQVGKRASDYYFPYDEPWCSDFVSWIMRQSGVPFWWGIDSNPTGWRIPYSGNIANGLAFFGNLRDRNYVPEAGDMVFFSWQDGNVPYDHIGIVTYVSGGSMTVVEGNSGPRRNFETQVEAHTWNRSSPYILAYGRWSR